MKKLLTTLFIIVLMFTMISAKEMIVENMPVNAAPIISSELERNPNLNTKAGPTALFYQGGQFYGQVPSLMTSIEYDSLTGYIQTLATVADTAGGGLFEGLYYRSSADNGVSWSSPTKIMDGGYYQHNSMDISQDGYPYVAGVIRTASQRGVWFTTDDLGAGGGNWRQPILLTDTVNYAAYYNQVETNADGSKATIMAWDWSSADPNDWSYGHTYSTDYGFSWSTYFIPTVWDATDAGSPMYYYETSTQRWADGDNVYAFMGGLWLEDSLWGVNIAMSTSDDGGQNYSALKPAFDNNERWPAHPPVNGDTLTYYIDTLDNGLVDSIPVKAWIEDTLWVDEIGNLDTLGFTTSNTTGTWWHKWDVEYSAGNMLGAWSYYSIVFDYVALENPDTIIDTTTTPHDTTIYDPGLYTFPDYWPSIVYGKMDIAGGDSTFTTQYVDVHNPITSPDGSYPQILQGYVYTLSVTHDPRNDDVYIVYADGLDQATGLFSTYMMKIAGGDPAGEITFQEVIHANDMLLVESPTILDSDGVMHCTYSTQAMDSIYYVGIDVDTISGITEKHAYNDNNAETFFAVPSVINGNDGEISFSIANAGNVRISLYDVTGREVMNLLNKEFSAGTHSVGVNTNSLSQGVYFANIMTDNGSDSKKVIIVK